MPTGAVMLLAFLGGAQLVLALGQAVGGSSGVESPFIEGT